MFTFFCFFVFLSHRRSSDACVSYSFPVFIYIRSLHLHFPLDYLFLSHLFFVFSPSTFISPSFCLNFSRVHASSSSYSYSLHLSLPVLLHFLSPTFLIPSFTSFYLSLLLQLYCPHPPVLSLSTCLFFFISLPTSSLPLSFPLLLSSVRPPSPVRWFWRTQSHLITSIDPREKLNRNWKSEPRACVCGRGRLVAFSGTPRTAQ